MTGKTQVIILENQFGNINTGKYCMKIEHLLDGIELDEWKASKELCKSKKPDSALGSSALSSCRSQGLRPRDSKIAARYGGSKKRRPIKGKVKGKKYGGPLPNWGG